MCLETNEKKTESENWVNYLDKSIYGSLFPRSLLGLDLMVPMRKSP